MNDLINIRIKKETLMKLLRERLHHWTDEEDFIDLYMRKYEGDFKMGVFDNFILDIDNWVDNDWINCYSIIDNSDSRFEEYLKSGDYEVTDYNETLMLIRN